MPLNFTIGELMSDLEKFLSTAERLHGTMTEPRHVQTVGRLLEKMRESQAQAQTILPQAFEQMHQMVSEMKTQGEQELARTQALITQIEQMKANPPEAPVPPPPPPKVEESIPDPALGMQLREELIKGFLKEEDTRMKPGKDIWQGWK